MFAAGRAEYDGFASARYSVACVVLVAVENYAQYAWNVLILCNWMWIMEAGRLSI